MALTALPLEARTLPAVFHNAVDASPDAPFLRWHDGQLSYRALDDLANAAALGLTRLGVHQRGKVAIMLGNSVEFIVVLFATAKLGAVYVPINTDYKGDILEHQLNLAEVSHLIIDAAWIDRIVATAPRLRHLNHVVVVGQSDGAKIADALTTASYAELVAEPGQRPAVAIAYTDPLAISFTSGTTGPSKGVLATHCHVLSFALDWIEACGVVPGDRLFTCLPMFHAIATWLGVIPALLTSNSLAFVPRFSASRFWEDVRTFDATVVHGIFAMIPILLKQPPRPDDATGPARIFYIGQRNMEFERRFGCRIVEVYGATETGIVSYTPLDKAGPAGSCGRPNARTYDVALVDDGDNPVSPGTPGEIVVRPRQPYSMFQEYYNMPEATLAACRNFWFHTGDNARADEDGFLYFVDRKKDAIRRRGENISSFEVESVLNADPRVLECAAVAHPSDLGEDEVRLIIVRQPGATLDADAVWQLCEERMPRFWIPRFVEFRASLPKTPNGKIQKYMLREIDEDADIHDSSIARRVPA